MLKSSRLYYKKLDKEDFDFFYSLFSDKNVMKYAYLDAFESEEAARDVFDKILSEKKQRQERVEYVAALKDSHHIIGIVDYEVLLKNPFGGIYEIGYFLSPDYWGKGYAAEMGDALINYVFENENVHKIAASCHAGNAHSESIMKKLGMHKEGVFRLTRYKDGEWVDEVRYSILKEEWVLRQQNDKGL